MSDFPKGTTYGHEPCAHEPQKLEGTLPATFRRRLEIRSGRSGFDDPTPERRQS